MFGNVTIKMRLVGLVAFLSVVAIGVGLLALRGMDLSNDGLKTVYEDRTMALRYLGQVERVLTSNRIQVTNVLLQKTPEAKKTAIDRMETNIPAMKKAWDAYASTSSTAEEKKVADVFEDLLKKTRTDSVDASLALLKKGDLDGLHALYTGEAIRKLNTQTRETLEKLIQIQLDASKEEYEGAVARFKTTRTVTLSTLVAALAVGSLLAFLIIRGIVSALARAIGVADAVASGDLTQDIASDRNDETGRLLQALRRMNGNLSGLVSKVRIGVDTIGTGSQQIASGNADLSQRTEEQASSLEETASSMEELASTVKQNAENAHQANRLAGSASEVAVKGGAVVGEVVQTMASINESSKKIADIIGTIDGIAFQTNILALNAAVEAARAGEQGRGFAVVASEVRTLAQRSASAAKEIKELISDSVSKVDAGTKLVDDAGRTMDEIVASVKRVTDIMSEITAAAQEQSSGIEQVNQAVMQMDQVTQQNAALVEEAAAAAESMREQAAALGQEIAVFKLSAEAATAPAPSVERRGPDRAKNVARLPAKASAKVEPRAEPKRTGTDDEWSEF